MKLKITPFGISGAFIFNTNIFNLAKENVKSLLERYSFFSNNNFNEFLPFATGSIVFILSWILIYFIIVGFWKLFILFLKKEIRDAKSIFSKNKIVSSLPSPLQKRIFTVDEAVNLIVNSTIGRTIYIKLQTTYLKDLEKGEEKDKLACDFTKDFCKDILKNFLKIEDFTSDKIKINSLELQNYLHKEVITLFK